MDWISTIITTIAGFLVNGILLTIPIAILSLILVFVFNFVQKKTRSKWIGAAALTLLLTFTLFFFLIHSWNIWNGFAQTDTSVIPDDVSDLPEFQADQPNVLFLLIRSLFLSFLTGIIFTILLLPFAFLGVSVFEFLKKKIPGMWPRFFLTCFMGSLVFILLLAAFPWIPVSLLYLAFFGL